MSNTKQNKTVNVDEVPNLDYTEIMFEEQKVNTPTFVITRGGFRVSDKEYSFSDDPLAIKEKDFWQRVVNKHPDGTKIEIVLFDKKKHRIW